MDIEAMEVLDFCRNGCNWGEGRIKTLLVLSVKEIDKSDLLKEIFKLKLEDLKDETFTQSVCTYAVLETVHPSLGALTLGELKSYKE